MLETIASSKFVVTDTYHCAVNALTMGKVVFGLGLNQAEQSSTVGEPKKRILFRMLDSADHYIEFNDRNLGAEERVTIIRSVLSRLGDAPSKPAAIGKMATHFRDTVAATFQSGLNRK